MVRFSSADVQRHWGKVQDTAIIEPVTISNNGRDRLVLLNREEYLRLKRRDRQVLTLTDFTEEDIAAIETANVPEEAKAFNHEIK